MSTSTRFAVAVHVLALLALDGDKPVTSETIASSVNTNPVVIRRILGMLARAGLVTSQPGSGGGASLARPPEQVALWDVYRVVDGSALFALHRRPPNPHCLCGRNIEPVLGEVFDEAETALARVLAGVSIADVARNIEARASGEAP